MKNMKLSNIKFILTALVLMLFASCNLESTQQKSDSGISKASVQVKTDANGHSTEQKNIMDRIIRDNEIGSLKHLYIISTFTGDVMEYSTVKGKVTSGSKRLSPKTVNGNSGNLGGIGYNSVNIGGSSYITDEILDDGGAYGDSGNYLYWFDAQGVYHQYYPSGGTYLHISDKPLRIKKMSFTFESDNPVK